MNQWIAELFIVGLGDHHRCPECTDIGVELSERHMIYITQSQFDEHIKDPTCVLNVIDSNTLPEKCCPDCER